MSKKTMEAFDAIAIQCRQLFIAKTKDYGLSWRVLRPSSLTDQIFIKAKRIRTIQQTKTQQVAEGMETEFIGIINYSIMALIQLKKGIADQIDLSPDSVIKIYDAIIEETKNLMSKKNHDYGEAWKEMRLSSITDIILMKLLRIKQIEDNQGKTSVSEGLHANYQDIINYAIFALIKLQR
jgi:hypothetical protein